MKNVIRILVGVVLLVTVLVSPVNVYSCGPFYTTVLFVDKGTPGIPLSEYIEGRFGVVQPTYPTLCLYAAYRSFSGNPLTVLERNHALELEKLPGTRVIPSPAYDQWIAARRAVVGEAPVPDYPFNVLFQDPSRNQFESYQNINDDAFATAARTLQQRIAQFGSKTPEIREWVHAQDAVFLSATAGETLGDLSPDAPSLLRADRAYQIASAHFYAREFTIAESLFTRIGEDAGSPWRNLSRYLVARTLIRKATLTATNQDSVLRDAHQRLHELFVDDSMGALHAAVKRLLNFCSIRTQPQRLFEELDRGIASQGITSITPDEWDDYEHVRWQHGDSISAGSSEFANWAVCYGNRGERWAFRYAIRQWKERHNNAWLVAALSTTTPRAPENVALFNAARRIPVSASSFVTARYWWARLLMDRKEDRLARKVLHAVVGRKNLMVPRSSINLVRHLCAKTAVSFAEFLKYSHQHPVATDWGGEVSAMLDDSLDLFTPDALVLNELVPDHMLSAACTSPQLPNNLQRALTEAVWVRSVLLGKDSIALAVTGTMGRLIPAMKHLLDGYQSAGDEQARRFAAAFILLKYPGLRPSVRIGLDRLTSLNTIDDFRDNWWYADSLAVTDFVSRLNMQSDPDAGLSRWGGKHPGPLFLRTVDRETARREKQTLVALPAAATYLGSIVTAWAKDHSGDPRVPEALHRAIEVSRVGCTDSESRLYSKEAFTILHRRYPQTEWARATKYWY